tara:strand:- start:4304 stop:4507 length:204 start_codon:yes stop_codon:yes gene_type:complete
MKILTKIKDLIIKVKDVLTGPVTWACAKHKELTLKFLDAFEISTYTACWIAFAKGLLLGGLACWYLC